MAALPYMQLYVADYLADTAHLNAAQHGAYLLLLMNYWQRGKALLDDNNRLANVARMSNEEWNANRTVLEEFFDVRDGMWHHYRVDRDLEAVLSKSEKAAAAGRASARRKLNDRKAREDQTHNVRSADVVQTLNHTDTDTDADTDTEQNRTEQKAGAPAPLAEPPFEISPQMIAKGVMDELLITGEFTLRTISDVSRGLLARGNPPEDIRDGLVRVRNDYLDYAKEGKLFGKPASPQKFFEEEMWKGKERWNLKNGIQ